jgi:hypothetical protein
LLRGHERVTAADGLMSYGGSITEGYRLVGSYVGRFLGERSQQNCLFSNPQRLSWLSI